MKICSLLPSATEILYALGLGEQVVGVSHECDYPPDAQAKPRIVRTLIDPDHLSSEAVDRRVHAALARHEPLYQVELEALQRSQPELIVTQALCDVCAIDASQVNRLIHSLAPAPRILPLHPHTIGDVFEDIRAVGEATGRQREAAQFIGSLRQRMERIRAAIEGTAARPQVCCVEWLKPLMACGHWVPEMVSIAGGVDVLGRAGAPSRYVTPEDIVATHPEVLILMPCGLSIERMRQELPLVTSRSWWKELPAVRTGRVYLVNGPAYFNRSGPRLIDGIELLAGLLHPERCQPMVAGEGTWAQL